MDSLRTRRVAELLKQEIASLISTEINDPRIHDVVLTRVKVTKDLGIARVYFSSYDKKALEDMEAGLVKSAGFIRRHLMSRLSLKKIPQIIFERDTMPENVVHMEDLLKQIEDEREGRDTDNEDGGE